MAYCLHKELLRQGHDSCMLVGYKYEDHPEIAAITRRTSLAGKVISKLLIQLENMTGMQYLIQPLRQPFLEHPFVTQADLIILHNLHGHYFSPMILPQLTSLAPTLWALHDTWSMTGHCSYPYDCERWKTGCGQCPNLQEYPPLALDTTAFLWRQRDLAYRRSRMDIVTACTWMTEMARASPLLNRFQIHHIPDGTDTSVFRPVGQREARREIGLPSDSAVILFFAFRDAPRKGLEYFLEAMHRVRSDSEAVVLAVGDKGVLGGLPSPFAIKEMGFVNDDRLLNICYCAADIFVLPTLADNLPLSLIEAMAAGVPAVAFDVGGVADLVRTGETGYLARYKDAGALATGINALLSDKAATQAMGAAARRLIEEKHSIAAEAERYLSLRAQILERSGKQCEAS